MRVIKQYLFENVTEWHRAETRVFNLLAKFTIDELRDLAEYRGVMHHKMNKTALIKSLMVGIGNTLSGKHFSNLKL